MPLWPFLNVPGRATSAYLLSGASAGGAILRPVIGLWVKPLSGARGLAAPGLAALMAVPVGVITCNALANDLPTYDGLTSSHANLARRLLAHAAPSVAIALSMWCSLLSGSMSSISSKGVLAAKMWKESIPMPKLGKPCCRKLF